MSNTNMSNSGIPLIDCSSIAKGDYNDICIEDFNAVAQQLGAAMTGIGMCNLINHGLDMKKIETIYNASTKFFMLPFETKIKYRKLSSMKSNHGYSCPGDQNFQANSTEMKEIWDISGFDGYDEKNYPIDEIPEFKPAFDNIRSDLENIGKKILRCIEIFLHFEKGFLISKHNNLHDRTIQTHTEMRSLYYYALNEKEKFPVNAIRCGEHKDWGTFTFVLQDLVGGLEVKTSEGTWIEAVPVKDAILMNSGMLLEYWTGGRFHAAPHRVRILPDSRMTDVPRQSFIYFIDPDGDVEVFPVLPVLPNKKVDLEKYENKSIVAYEHNQRLIEAYSRNASTKY